MDVGVGARELYESLTEGNRPNASWLGRDHGGYRDRLATAAEYKPWWTAPEGQGLLWESYALSRVCDLLLESEYEHPGPFTPLGMTPFRGGTFDPFLHEIVDVEQADDPRTRRRRPLTALLDVPTPPPPDRRSVPRLGSQLPVAHGLPARLPDAAR
ncbi:hypothetical protein AQJ46_41060 [Streptomyces canus]|uniref:Uncharacterized protein n=1 Tax=Streptomyces canus TaxID=58343 RepID=A0A124HVN6_9ACTN|nr:MULTISPECIES: hypothetical protein [Streptomyces]KUN58995.1 hypothetical protein AQJ46_41060 [Streptomyces canus]MDI5904568.1 hypothetical protein [Streptomyces sp. 12257]